MSQQPSSRSLATSNYFTAFSLSVILHAILLAGLLLGDFATLPKPKPDSAKKSGEPIKAIVVDKAKLEQAVNKIQKQKDQQLNAEKKRIRDAEKRAADAKKRRARE